MLTLATIVLVLWVATTCLPGTAFVREPVIDWHSPMLYLTIGRELAGLILAIVVLILV